MVTFGDMADALDRLRKRDGYLAYHSKREIYEEATKFTQAFALHL